jgi:glucose-6-phosphate isomerase
MLDLLTRWPSLDIPARHARLKSSCRSFIGPLKDAVGSQQAGAARAAEGLWRRDPSVWSEDPSVQQRISNRLGWLDSPLLMADEIDRLRGFADGVKRAGFTDVVLLGMGGSSLAPEVLRAILGTAPGYPRFQMIDSTDPAAVEAVATDVRRTLYILASKSGGTIEPNSLAAHFRGLLEQAGVPRWADQFVAITDQGTALAERARTEKFRDIFINPSDIGGRYSALSFFGLVPAALMGQDLEALVGWGLAMLAVASESPGHVADNPAVGLGLSIGAAAHAGRDKLTLVGAPELEPFGLWVEQLIAESTGKQGVGVIPIVGETAGSPETYGADRLFAALRVGGGPETAALLDLQSANAPVIAIDLPDRYALGAEFVRWEIATAIAGALLEINPFDEPNVQQAKDATGLLLEKYGAEQRLPISPPDVTRRDGVALTLSHAARKNIGGAPERLLTEVRPGDYLAILAYLGPSARLMDALRAFRNAARDRTRAATTLAYGPRYLHSTGQLHKGGPPSGVFMLITASPERDIPIPGEPFSFGTLELAQALGDFSSLDAAGRRVLHVHLPRPDAGLLGDTLGELLDATLAPR